jgi:DNA-binding response OmpR family regulator
MRHLLVVDDCPAICDVVKMALEADGTCFVTGASTAFDALVVLRHDRPDGAIIDASMPAVSGIGIASQALTLGVPVLMMTGEPRAREAFFANGIPFLAKPFRAAEVIGEARLLLRDARKRHAQLTMQMTRVAANIAELRQILERSSENLERLLAARLSRERR